MEYIIHLTDSCNLNCTYCYENKRNRNISFENIKDICDYEISQNSKSANIIFYGGEPLLQKELITKTIDYIKSKKSKTVFYFGITTNGTLLDKKFIKYMKKNNFVSIGYSIDGLKDIHNLNRKTVDGNNTFDVVYKNAKELLKVFKDAVSMSVITKNSLNNLANSVEFLIKTGFREINLLFDYSQNWQDDDLKEIENQFFKISEIYASYLLNEIDIDIPILDEKIRTHIDGKYNCNDDCGYGFKSINVGTDGNFYPCMQFVDKKEYIIGDCKKGINREAQLNLIKNSRKETSTCKNCAIRTRCKHTCSCKNYSLTKDINGVSPFICETEKIFISIADKMAEKLYKKNSKLFIQKFYNKNYNIIKHISQK